MLGDHSQHPLDGVLVVGDGLDREAEHALRVAGRDTDPGGAPVEGETNPGTPTPGLWPATVRLPLGPGR